MYVGINFAAKKTRLSAYNTVDFDQCCSEGNRINIYVTPPRLLILMWSLLTIELNLIKDQQYPSAILL